MKKLLLILIFCLSLNIQVFSADENTSDYWVENNLIIKKAKLVEKYINEHRNKIILFTEKYEIKNNAKIEEKIDILEEMIDVLRTIQEKNIVDERWEKALVTILQKLKTINKELQFLLIQEKEKYNNNIASKKASYSKLWIKLSEQLNRVILKLIWTIKDKENLTDNEKQLISHLKELEKEKLKLKNIWNNNFKNSAEIKSYFLQILKNMKKEMINIKKLK